MDNTLSLNFSIKEFESSRDKDFVEALKIYNDNIPVEIRTSTNDIIQFADNKFEQPNRKMFFFGLYTNNKLMGFVMCGYLKLTKTIIIDYIVLKNEFHLNSVFYPLFSLLLQFFSDALIDYDYIVTEVGNNCPDGYADRENFFSKRMLQMEDFKIIKHIYLQPKLGYTNEESYTQLQLMIKSTQIIKSIKKETFLAIVRDIYFEHYLAWYKAVESEYEEKYKHHIEELYKKIEIDLNDSDKIELLDNIPSCLYYNEADCHYSSTAGFLKNQKSKNRPILLAAIPIIAVMSFVVSFLIFNVLLKFHMDSPVFAGLFAAITALCTGIFSIAFTKVTKK